MYDQTGLRRIDIGSMTEFSSLMKQMREARGLSRMIVAANLGMHERTIGFIESGRRRPSMRMVFDIADALGLKVFSPERARLLHAAGLRAESDVDEFCPELAELNDRWLKADPAERAKIERYAQEYGKEQERPTFDNRFAGVNQGWLRR